MTMNLVSLYGTELQHQMEMLRKEIAGWQKQSLPATLLRRHQTQLDRIAYILTEFLNKAEQTGTMEENKLLEARLLFARRTFLHFTSKIGQRAIPMYTAQLECADAFAWQCYEPLRLQAEAAQEKKLGELKAPPLVYYSHAVGPVIYRRGTPFLPEGVTSDDEYGMAIASLPIPLIEVPWFLAEHLPSGSVIAHEVGHAVERDFGADKVHISAIDALHNLDAQQREIWQAWRAELFADVFGALCVGPAHLLALIPFLADTTIQVRTEEPVKTLKSPKWGDYPIAQLRVDFNLAVLRQLRLDDAGIGAAWQQVYGDTASWPYYSELKKNIDSIVAAFLDAELLDLGGKRIQDVMVTTSGDWENVKGRAAALTKVPADDPKYDVFRWIYAAATYAYYTEPNQYKTNYMFGYNTGTQLTRFGKIETMLKESFLETMRYGKPRSQDELDRVKNEENKSDQEAAALLEDFFTKMNK